MFPAARVGDLHLCPLVLAGGPILPPGEPTVLIGFFPAARVGDLATCAGPPDPIVRGEPTVLIGHRPAARTGDQTALGGTIALGCPTVLIGSSPQAAALTAAAENGTPFCEDCENTGAPPEEGST